MEKDFVEVNTNKYLNLRSLAEEFDISMEELVRFHNDRCFYMDRISVHISNYVEFVYMPIDKYENREEKYLVSEWIQTPCGQSEKVYGIIVNFHPKELQLHYKMNVKRNKYIMTLNKERVYINNRGIENIVEKMFEKVDMALYPLKVALRQDGSIDHIINREELIKRWSENILPELREYYDAALAETIISKINDAFINLENRCDLLKRNLFYKLFFLPIYMHYPNFEQKLLVDIYFSSIYKTIRYEMNCIINKIYSDSGKIVMKIKGNEEENFFNRDKKRGFIEIQYKFHRKMQEIFSIVGNMTTYEKGQEYKVDFKLFEQKK